MPNIFIVILVVTFIVVLWCVVFPEAGADTPTRYTKATERRFQEAHHWGQMEFRLEDGTRVDDLTSKHAIEYDFAKKWAEALGQSMHYARLTGKKAGIVLILEKDSDAAKLDNILALIDEHNLKISVWTVRNLSTPPNLVRK